MSHTEQFLERLVGSDRAIDASQVALLVAHPDDETLGCGGQLFRLRGALLTVTTDGSPENLADARRENLRSREEYAALRAAELRNALTVCNAPVELIALGVGDQRASFHMFEAVHELLPLLRRRGTRILMTHAYEGGHPDHDATACVAHHCARLLRRRGQDVSVIEMPFYTNGPHGMLRQRFPCACEHPELEVVLSRAARSCKLRMLAAHRSQRGVLGQFDTTTERFRLAPEYDFSQPPNGRALLYERYPWGMSGELWKALVQATQRRLDASLPGG
nr:PIG-L family deacetylase [uncultured Steroidobacter sp.]